MPKPVRPANPAAAATKNALFMTSSGGLRRAPCPQTMPWTKPAIQTLANVIGSGLHAGQGSIARCGARLHRSVVDHKVREEIRGDCRSGAILRDRNVFTHDSRARRGESARRRFYVASKIVERRPFSGRRSVFSNRTVSRSHTADARIPSIEVLNHPAP